MRAVLLALAGCAAVVTLINLASFTPVRHSVVRAVDPDFHAAMQMSDLKVSGLADMHYRYSVFAQNKKIIADGNARNAGFTLGVGPFALYTFEEFKDKMGMHTYGSAQPVPKKLKKLKAASVNWKGVYDVTPVKNQSTACNAGYAMAVAGALESSVKKYRKDTEAISSQQLIDCSTPFGNMGCRGGWADKAMNFIKSNNGVASERDYPYTALAGQCQSRSSYAAIKGYFNLANENSIMAALNSQPVILGFEYNTDLQHYTGGVYTNRACGSNLNHFGVGVGYVYNDAYSSYWTIKNSFGNSWGEAGYLRMDFYTCGVARNTFNQALME